jgi:hypothetical protein
MTHTRHVVGLIALLLVGLYVVTAYAVTGPSSVQDDSSALTVADFEPTDSGFVQAIKVEEDNDGNPLQVNSITIRNNASAPLADAGDIDKIEIWKTNVDAAPNPAQCAAGTKVGETTDIAAFNSASGVTIALTGAVVNDDEDTDGDTDHFCVKIITKSGLTPGRKIKSKILSASGIDPAGAGGIWSGGPTSGTGEGPEFVTNSGFKVVADATPSGQKSVAPGGQVFAQIIKVADETASAPDFNTLAVTVNSITIDNLGTATPADVASIQIFNCGTDASCGGSPSLMGTSTVSSFPVTIPLVASNTFADDSTERYIGVRVTVSSTPGHTFRLRSTLNVTENPSVGSVTTGNIDVPTGKETIIEVAGFETFQVLGSFTPPATITSGESNVAVLKVQAKDGTSGDVNNQALKVTSITINNLGTATLGGDITNIKIICSGGGDCSGSAVVNKSYSSAATFPQTFTGADILATGNDIDIPDNADVTFEVQVTISSTPGNTIQLTFALSGTEGSLGSFNQGPVNHSQVTTIASGIGCEVLTDLNIGPATIASGSTNVVVQNIKCEDSDGNGQNIVVNSITITNLGTANGGDIAKIQYGTCSDDACTIPGISPPRAVLTPPLGPSPSRSRWTGMISR